MSPREILRHEFDAEEGSFLLQARVRLKWDWDAFRRLTSAMYDVADEAKGQPSVETWIAQGFWFCDTWIRDHTSHPNFPRPPEDAYRDAIELVRNLATFLFLGENPYKDDTPCARRPKAKLVEILPGVESRKGFDPVSFYPGRASARPYNPCMNDNVELVECDDCHAVKPTDEFRSPGHTAGGQVNGYDIDSCVCAECGQRGYEDFQKELAEAALAEMAAEEKAAGV